MHWFAYSLAGSRGGIDDLALQVAGALVYRYLLLSAERSDLAGGLRATIGFWSLCMDIIEADVKELFGESRASLLVWRLLSTESGPSEPISSSSASILTTCEDASWEAD